jgi:non-heme chloroperoxidase
MSISLRQRYLLTMSVGLFLPLLLPAQTVRTKSVTVTTTDGVQIHYIEADVMRMVGRFRVGGPPPKAGETSIGNLTVEMEEQPAILLVPGWTMPAWIWEKQIDHFSKSHRVVAMDPRGQGESSKPTEGYFPAARARDIKAVVDQLKLAPVVLVGWSMGVTELASYVDQFGTADLAGLVFVDDVPGADVPAERYKNVLNFINGFIQDRQGATDPFVRSFFKKPQPEEYLKRVVEASMNTPTNTAVTLLVGKFGADLRPALKKIDKPTLIVAARSGFLYLIQAIQPQIAGSRLEIFEDAGHALFVDDDGKFNALLDEFLKSLQRSP